MLPNKDNSRVSIPGDEDLLPGTPQFAIMASNVTMRHWGSCLWPE
jgi:hypothetical protein